MVPALLFLRDTLSLVYREYVKSWEEIVARTNYCTEQQNVSEWLLLISSYYISGSRRHTHEIIQQFNASELLNDRHTIRNPLNPIRNRNHHLMRAFLMTVHHWTQRLP
ncbi:hypothetical protein TNCV_5012171 [Trichonephila clavipes]|nr:hypothetical protein TNCV_5012171 [Trichonephila clavipes]